MTTTAELPEGSVVASRYASSGAGCGRSATDDGSRSGSADLHRPAEHGHQSARQEPRRIGDCENRYPAAQATSAVIVGPGPGSGLVF